MKRLFLLVKIVLSFGAFLAHEHEAAASAAVARAETLGRVPAPAASCTDPLNLAVVTLKARFLNRTRDFHPAEFFSENPYCQATG